jgi:hypothetical protein
MDSKNDLKLITNILSLCFNSIFFLYIIIQFILTILNLKKKVFFTTSTIFMITLQISTFFIMLSYIIYDSPNTNRLQCTLQASQIQFFHMMLHTLTLSIALWLLFNLYFYKLINRLHEYTRYMIELVFLFYCIGISLIFTIIPIFSEKIIYNKEERWCWIDTNDKVSFVFLFSYYIPVVI